MSAIEKPKALWPQYQNDQLNSKYEKCKHITEEIYKRINITFQIKSLGTGSQSDTSEQSDHIEIDSNELSNGTDLFAYEQSDSLPSSAGEGEGADRKCLTVNNNEIKKTAVPVYKPPRKSVGCRKIYACVKKRRFRKKVKKRVQKARADTEGSSDEAPLSRMVDGKGRDCPAGKGSAEGKDRIRDATTYAAPPCETSQETAEFKPIQPREQAENPNLVEDIKNEDTKADLLSKPKDGVEASSDVITVNVKAATETKKCNMCSLSFRGERGLRRHMAMTHILIPEVITRPKTRQTEVRAESSV